MNNDVAGQLALAARVAEMLASSLGAVTDTTDAVRNAAERQELARELTALLHGTDQDRNRRAVLVMRCPKGKASYRVFRTVHGRLLGVSAHEPWLAGGTTGWVRLPDWLPTKPSGGMGPLDGRCRCCRRPQPIGLPQILGEIEAGRRSAVIGAIGS